MFEIQVEEEKNKRKSNCVRRTITDRPDQYWVENSKKSELKRECSADSIDAPVKSRHQTTLQLKWQSTKRLQYVPS